MVHYWLQPPHQENFDQILLEKGKMKMSFVKIAQSLSEE